jgi:menaquinone-9 beta-reductase
MGSPYDVVVVGAGPGGSAAAATLARGGARVLLCDRSGFPRDKACGGGLTPRGVAAAERMGVDTAGPAFVRVGGVHMAGGGRSSTVAFPATARWPGHGTVVRRSDLDALLLEEAVRAGAEFRSGVRVLGPVVEDGVCRGIRAMVDGSRAEIAAPLVIGADGATSVLARGSGAGGRSGEGRGFWYAALRAYFSGVEPMCGGDGAALEFYPLRGRDGRWLPAYGWVFPLPDGTANVGVDIPHRPGLAGCPPLREAYDRFVDRMRAERPGFAGAREQAPPVGALLPEAMRGFTPGVPGLLLVGDAAGLITPYSGEGIVYALESAELAGAAVLADGSPNAVLRSYEDAVWDAYGFQFATALAIMKSMRRPGLARLAATIGIGRPRLLRAAVRVMAYLIDDDADGGRSTVATWYERVRRAVPLRRRTLWG